MPLSALHGLDTSDTCALVKPAGLPAVAAVSIIAGLALACAVFALTSSLDAALFAGMIASLLPIAFAYRAVGRTTTLRWRQRPRSSSTTCQSR